jgi:hypothetical protein
MNDWIRTAVVACALLGTAGCAPPSVTAIVLVELEDATDAERQASAPILEARCRAYLGSYFSEVSARPVRDGVRIEFRGAAPPERVIQKIASTQGVMRISSQRSPHITIVSDRDVVAATPVKGEDSYQLELVLSGPAGQRMLEYTRRHQGELLVTTWDGGEPTSARIAGVFGPRFQTTGLDRETTLLRAVLLRGGRLPKPVKSVVIDHPKR